MLAVSASLFGCGASKSDADEAAAANGSGAASNPVASPAASASSSAATSRPAAAPPAAEMPATAVKRDLPVSEASASAAARPSAPAPSPTFAACLDTGGAYSDCNTLYVTMTQASPARCVQLTIDDCGGYGARSGLSADLPTSWRLASGSVGSSSAPCELGVFYPANTIIGDASGSISWDESSRQPSQIELKLTLAPYSSTGGGESIALATSEPLNPSPCED